MNFIYVTQQLYTNHNNESHSSLDSRWHEFFVKAGLVPVLLPNHLEIAQQILSLGMANAALMTGGGEFDNSGSDARSQVEDYLMHWSIAHARRLIGVCRSMQAMMQFHGAKLIPCHGQVVTKQDIVFRDQEIQVNSYHNYQEDYLPSTFQRLAYHVTESNDCITKAVIAPTLPWFGVMWHPERLAEFRAQDVEIFSQFVKTGSL